MHEHADQLGDVEAFPVDIQTKRQAPKVSNTLALAVIYPEEWACVEVG
jgi:hypothetical protein